MREIKFRGMTLSGKWVYGLLAHSEGLKNQVKKGYYISNKAGSPFAYGIRSETIGQYTGLKDENGTEIYEGDILYDRTYNLLFTVIFDDGVFCANYAGWAYKPLCSSCAYSKIVDNIYENPELLNN